LLAPADDLNVVVNLGRVVRVPVDAAAVVKAEVVVDGDTARDRTIYNGREIKR